MYEPSEVLPPFKGDRTSNASYLTCISLRCFSLWASTSAPQGRKAEQAAGSWRTQSTHRGGHSTTPHGLKLPWQVQEKNISIGWISCFVILNTCILVFCWDMVSLEYFQSTLGLQAVLTVCQWTQKLLMLVLPSLLFSWGNSPPGRWHGHCPLTLWFKVKSWH